MQTLVACLVITVVSPSVVALKQHRLVENCDATDCEWLQLAAVSCPVLYHQQYISPVCAYLCTKYKVRVVGVCTASLLTARSGIGPTANFIAAAFYWLQAYVCDQPTCGPIYREICVQWTSP